MTIFEYHPRMETGMLRITCSGTPREVRDDDYDWGNKEPSVDPRLTQCYRSV